MCPYDPFEDDREDEDNEYFKSPYRKKYRYRLLRTLRNDIVGVALDPPDDDLIMKIGDEVLEFDSTAPKLEFLQVFIEKIAEKPQFKNLGLYDCGRIRELDARDYISLDDLILNGYH